MQSRRKTTIVTVLQRWWCLRTLSEHLSKHGGQHSRDKGLDGGANVLHQGSVALKGALAGQRVCGAGSRLGQAVSEAASLEAQCSNISVSHLTEL